MSLPTSLIILILGLTAIAPITVAADNNNQNRYSEYSDKADQLIRNGLSLHYSGKYYEAVEAYEQALIEDPDNIFALYEMALAYLTAGDYDKAHTSARRGMGNRSPLVAELYALSATALDQMGKPEEAVNEFVQAIKAFPDNFSLHFNLAVTYAGLGDFKNTQKAAEGTLRVKPDHPSAHFMLGQLYARQNEKIPAAMALGRFLTLEPTSQRSDAAISGLKEPLKSNYTLKQDGTPVIVIGVDDVVNPEGEGTGFQSIASQLKLISATAAISQAKSKDMSFTKSPEYFGLIMLCCLVSNQANYPAGFAKNHYVPFYRTIEQRGFNNAFARLALASLDPGGASDWMKENRESFSEFTKWSRSYAEPDSNEPDSNRPD